MEKEQNESMVIENSKEVIEINMNVSANTTNVDNTLSI